MKLHIGIMDNQELSEWFGIKYQTFRNTKVKRLKILEEYANFEIIDKGRRVNIIDIYEEEYIDKRKTSKTRTEELTKQNWKNNEVNTISNVALKNSYCLYNEGYRLKDKYVYRLTSIAKTNLWGNSKTKEPGKIGWCERVWAKRIEKDDQVFFEVLTIEELDILKKVSRETYKEFDEMQDMLDADFADGNISENEWIAESLELVKEKNDFAYTAFMIRVEEILGFRPILASIRHDFKD